MIIRKLTEYERDTVKAFYLALSADDRRKRFCCMISDEGLSKYVASLNTVHLIILIAFSISIGLRGLA